MTDHGSIPLDSNFDFGVYGDMNLLQQHLLIVAGCKQSIKPQALLHFSKIILPFLLGFLKFFAITPNLLAHCQGLFSILSLPIHSVLLYAEI